MADNKTTDPDDDRYVIEDTGASVDEIEHEMAEAAQEAVGEPPSPEPAPVNESANPTDEVRDLKDRYLRTLADFENFRKRSDREKADYFKYALTGTIRELLPVLDNFDRALEHAEAGDDFHQGVLMIYKQLADVLQKSGVRVVGEAGGHFDPNIHEAVVREEDASVPSHTVSQVLQKGYFLHDRLIRPALVKVAVGGPEPATDEPS
jgi:molecular chaperone GrpE